MRKCVPPERPSSLKRPDETAEPADAALYAPVEPSAPRRRMAWPAAALTIILVSVLLWLVVGAVIVWMAG